MANTSSCPFCNYPIDPNDLTVTCKHCGKVNEHHNVLLQCDFCHRDIDKIVCPKCGNEFNGMLLIGSYTYKFKNIEFFIVPPVDNDEAVMFFNKIPENIEYDLRWDESPKTMLVIELKYDSPNYSVARGLLISLDIDRWEKIINQNEPDSLDPYLKKYVIGIITIEYGGNITGVNIDAKPFKM